MESKKAKPGRRGFLIGVGTVGAAGAAAVVAGKGVAPAPSQDAKPDTKGRGGGYRVTDHVRRYYKTTLV